MRKRGVFLGVLAMVLAAGLVWPSYSVRAEETAKYVEYSPQAFEAAKDQTRVLFFHAAWCPSCVATGRSITANIEKIPAGVVVFKVDYDNSKSLQEKYAVPYQDTFVKVDHDGKKLALWNGGGVEELLRNLM